MARVKVTKTERGWGGHFVGAHLCLFRRNTLLECGEERIVVSTVGNYTSLGGLLHEHHVPEEIGHQRYYETMAFEARYEDGYWDASEVEVTFDCPWRIETKYEDAKANDMHEAAVRELSRKMVRKARNAQSV